MLQYYFAFCIRPKKHYQDKTGNFPKCELAKMVGIKKSIEFDEIVSLLMKKYVLHVIFDQLVIILSES